MAVRKAVTALAVLVLAACASDRPPPPTPFERAILEGDVDYVDAHVDARQQRPAEGNGLIDGMETAAQACPRNDLQTSLEMYRIFVAAGADVNTVYLIGPEGDREETTPLIRAAFYCPVEVVDLLVDSGANVSQTTADGLTPLMSAADAFYYNVEDKVTLLLAAGATPGATDAEGRTALDYAFANTHVREYPEVMRILSASGPAGPAPLGRRAVSERVE
jgi:hypothetical protein